MRLNICIYCSSSNHVEAGYFDVAEETGRLLAERRFTLVYGGGNVGLMGRMARSVHAHGGQVVGVIPEALKQREGVAYDVADQLITTATMQKRKAIMFTRADAFMVLPGGFGTLEEFLEVLTLRQLGYHNKPIALVNTDGFYDPLLELFDHFFRERFAHKHSRAFYYIASDPEDALRHIEAYIAAHAEE
ncbi:MAG: TIGR00730 family Rossman fold protein [Rhodothermales bacterium]